MVSVDGVMKLENETGLVYNQFLSRLPMRLLHAAAPTHPAFSKHDPAPMKGLGANLNATWGLPGRRLQSRETHSRLKLSSTGLPACLQILGLGTSSSDSDAMSEHILPQLRPDQNIVRASAATFIQQHVQQPIELSPPTFAENEGFVTESQLTAIKARQ